MTIPDEFTPRILVALDYYVAYMKATQRDEQPYQEVREFLLRKGPGKEESGAGGIITAATRQADAC